MLVSYVVRERTGCHIIDFREKNNGVTWVGGFVYNPSS